MIYLQSLPNAFQTPLDPTGCWAIQVGHDWGILIIGVLPSRSQESQENSQQLDCMNQDVGLHLSKDKSQEYSSLFYNLYFKLHIDTYIYISLLQRKPTK